MLQSPLVLRSLYCHPAELDRPLDVLHPLVHPPGVARRHDEVIDGVGPAEGKQAILGEYGAVAVPLFGEVDLAGGLGAADCNRTDTTQREGCWMVV